MSGIFNDLKILDFTWVIVGPRVTRYFADQGATVVKIENSENPCILRQSPPYKEGKSGINRSAYFAAMNTNKLSLGINLRNPKGVEVVKKLVAWADIVAESFSPGAIERLGFGYTDLIKLNPRVIMVRSSMLGASGPLARARGFGFQLTGYAGFTEATGWPDQSPVPPYGPYTDSIAPRFIASALIMALMHRDATGEGSCIDLSQHEAGIYFMQSMLLEYQKNGRRFPRPGNSDSSICPNGVYPCMGEEQWLALSIENDQQWQSLSGIINEEWVHEGGLCTMTARKQKEDEINRHLASWTSKQQAEGLVNRLQSLGIPAGVVFNGRDISKAPQLAHRRAIWDLKTEDTGHHAVFSQGFLMSRAEVPPPMPAPRLGEHSYAVCKEILNMSDETIVNLFQEGVLQST